MKDIFEPRDEPARTLYLAFQEEAEKRPGKSTRIWMEQERYAMWRAARDYARHSGLRAPAIAEVERAEELACGHEDYGRRWAYGVCRAMGRV